MVKMAKRPYEELIELLKRELDDRLRVVLRLGSDDSERLFARDDLSRRSDEELGEPFARAFPGSDERGDLFPGCTGGSECLVGIMDDTVVVLLYRHANEAVAIAFDRAPEDALVAFAERCQVAMP